MIDLTPAELDRLYEGSKDDRFIVVGSEVRQMVGMIRRAQDRIAALKATLTPVLPLAEAAAAFDSEPWTGTSQRLVDQIRAALAPEQSG